MSEVELRNHGSWAEVVLNRPHRRNAITGPLGVALGDAFAAAQTDDEIIAVLFRGADDACCSGLDLDSFGADPSPEWMAEWPGIWRRAHRALFDCDKPIVCALQRFAINGGAALVLASDFTIVGNSSYLMVGEVKLGMAAPYNLAWLSMRFPEAVATRLAVLGERLTGPELVECGIALRSLPDEEVLGAARELTRQLADYPHGAGARIKHSMRRLSGIDVDQVFETAIALAKGGAAPPRRDR